MPKLQLPILPPPALPRGLKVEAPTPELGAAVLARLDALLLRAQQTLTQGTAKQAGDARAIARPALRYFARSTTAGRAYLAQNVLALNGPLLAANPDAMLTDTVAHELAHLLVYQLWGRDANPHGPQWQLVMTQWLGVTASRTHQFDTSGLSVRQQRRWRYVCGCQTHMLTTTRHHRAQKRGQKRGQYHCVACRGLLRYQP